jgi:signal transduction histidine kinase
MQDGAILAGTLAPDVDAPLDDRHALFASNQLIVGISDAAFERFSREMEIVEFAAGGIIFLEDDPGDCLYLIARGSVRISKKGRGGQQETLSLLTDGDFFGEMALVDSGVRSAQASAETDCVLGRVDRKAWALLLRVAAQQVLGNFTRTVTKRLRHNNQHFIDQMMRVERLSLLGGTISAIMHDMNNPISSILAATELMTGRTDDPVLIGRMTNIIRDSVDRMRTMARELVEFSSGNTRLEVQPTPVAKLLDALEHELQRCRQANVHVETVVLYDGDVEIDYGRMLRVFSNLVRNARHAMKKTEGGRLVFCVRRSGDSLSFEVADNGCGIPKEILPRVFEPFVTHGKAHGTGLGLAISKSIVDAHGGTIQVRSTEGTGTIFAVEIPLQARS